MVCFDLDYRYVDFWFNVGHFVVVEIPVDHTLLPLNDFICNTSIVWIYDET